LIKLIILIDSTLIDFSYHSVAAKFGKLSNKKVFFFMITFIIVTATIINAYFNGSHGRQFIQFPSRQLFAAGDDFPRIDRIGSYPHRIRPSSLQCRRMCWWPNQVQGDLNNGNTSRVLPEDISYAAFKHTFHKRSTYLF